MTVTGAGSLWSDIAGIRIGNSGTGTLTIADGGNVIAPTVTIATNAGSIGTLNIGAGVGNPAAAPGTLTAPSVAFGAGTGTINFNHTSADYVFAPAISGGGTVNVLAGTTILTAANDYTGATNVSGGALASGRRATVCRISGGGAITVGRRNARWLRQAYPAGNQRRRHCARQRHAGVLGLADGRVHHTRQLYRRWRHNGHQYRARGRRLALRQIGHQRRGRRPPAAQSCT